jgi:hypothetical protein
MLIKNIKTKRYLLNTKLKWRIYTKELQAQFQIKTPNLKAIKSRISGVI